MLSKFITGGNKVEMMAVGNPAADQNADKKKKMYTSQVQSILSEDTLEIVMPMEKTKLVLLPVDTEYDMVLYGDTGLYQCFARIIDRYKSNNVYIMVAELTSNLRKYQRREYYRFSCALDMHARNLEETEVQAIENNLPCDLSHGLPLKQSVIVDISGGGLRFVSDQRYEPDSLIYISYNLLKKSGKKECEVVGKVLSSRVLENRPGTYEHRVQYVDMDTETREEIIKYIFEAERKSRRKEKSQ